MCQIKLHFVGPSKNLKTCHSQIVRATFLKLSRVTIKQGLDLTLDGFVFFQLSRISVFQSLVSRRGQEFLSFSLIIRDEIKNLN